MPVTCAQIMSLPGLEELHFRAGLQGGNRTVRWPYIAESDSISSWVNGGELVFITGTHHRRNEANLKKLIKEASLCDVAGVVILTGDKYIRKIPKSILDLSNELKIPLVEQPYNLKLVTVTEIVSNAIIYDNIVGDSRKSFLMKLINGFSYSSEVIALRANDLGLGFEYKYCSVVMKVRVAIDSSDLIKLEKNVYKSLHSRGIEFPLLLVDDSIIAILPISSSISFREDVSSFIDNFKGEGGFFDVGVSDCFDNLSKLSMAVNQAKKALVFSARSNLKKQFFYDEIGIAKIISSVSDQNILIEYCKEQLSDLCFNRSEKYINLKDTLNLYLNNYGNQQKTADDLGIHRNSLRYRVKKIEGILGKSLEDPTVRLNVQNAILIEMLIFQDHGIEL